MDFGQRQATGAEEERTAAVEVFVKLEEGTE